MIYFQDIQFRYEGTISSEIGVKDINLIVHTGECVLLCGRSGCGKTTLTKLINGLIPNYFPGELSGNVQIDDENILGMPMYYLATKVGSVFQNPRTQFFNVDVDSEIAFGIENIAVPPDELHQRLEYTLDSLKIRKLQGKNIFELSGGEKETTNNRMELTAVISALAALKTSCDISLYTDSKYVMDGITRWLPNWKKNGWKTSNKKSPVKNVDLWQRLDELAGGHEIRWIWVKGHAGHAENERVDELARNAIRNLA